MSVELLPANFSDLEFLVADWAVDGEAARRTKRLSSSFDQLRDFYQIMIDRMEAIGAHLDRFSLESLPLPETRLFRLALMFMETAPAVELFKQPTVPYAIKPERQVIYPVRF